MKTRGTITVGNKTFDLYDVDFDPEFSKFTFNTSNHLTFIFAKDLVISDFEWDRDREGKYTLSAHYAIKDVR